MYTSYFWFRKWIIIDEIGMVSDHLLGSFATAMADASSRSKRFKERLNEEERIFGGYNLLMFGDFQQLAPCPPGGPPCATAGPPSAPSCSASPPSATPGTRHPSV